MQDKLRADAKFRDVTSDAQLRALQAQLQIDRDRANALGVSMEAVRTACMGRLVSGRYQPFICRPIATRSSLEAEPQAKADESAINGVYVRATSGALVPCRHSPRSCALWGQRPSIMPDSCRR